MNYIEEYNSKIESGEIIACEKIKTVYRKMVSDIDNKDNNFYFSERQAEKVIKFIETFCCIPKFKNGKQPFKLQLWQKAMISCIFGFYRKDNDKRRFREIFLYVGRKNAKTCLCAAIIIYLMLFSKESAQEVYSCASDRQQAKIIWEYVRQMITTSPLLSKYFKIRVNEISVRKGFNKFLPLSKNSGSMDGLSPSVLALDELHALKDRNMYDVIKGGMYARSEPLTLIMSTGGFIEQGSIFDSKYQEYNAIIRGYSDKQYTDDTVLPLLYELDSKEDIDNKLYEKANPNLGVSKQAEDLEREINRARLDEKTFKDLLVKQFNFRENSRDTFFTYEDIANNETFNVEDFKGKYFVAGVDLSITTDLTCATAIIPFNHKLNVMQMYFLPESTLQEHIARDNVPYDKWIKSGYLRLCKGNIINPSDICAWFKELQEKYKIYMWRCGYDRFNATYLVDELSKTFGKNICVAVNQSFKGVSNQMYESKAYFQANRIVYNNNPIFMWNLLNTQGQYDNMGNVKPFKNRNMSKKIDGYSSFLDAFVVYLDNKKKFG